MVNSAGKVKTYRQGELLFSVLMSVKIEVWSFFDEKMKEQEAPRYPDFDEISAHLTAAETERLRMLYRKRKRREKEHKYYDGMARKAHRQTQA